MLYLKENYKKIALWLCMGLIFLGVTNLILFFFVEVLYFSILVATLVTVELTTILRYFANSYIVFGEKISIRDLIKYHIANLAAIAVWWTSVNIFAILGMHYLIASTVAVLLSTTISFYSNFFWVWKKSKH